MNEKEGQASYVDSRSASVHLGVVLQDPRHRNPTIHPSARESVSNPSRFPLVVYKLLRTRVCVKEPIRIKSLKDEKQGLLQIPPPDASIHSVVGEAPPPFYISSPSDTSRPRRRCFLFLPCFCLRFVLIFSSSFAIFFSSIYNRIIQN